MKRLLITLAAFTATILCRAEPQLPAVFGLSAKDLVAARERLERHDPALLPALERLQAEAGKLLRKKPVSVMDKSRTPPSGDKHDYLSLAPYFWPNPKKPDGLPYVRRDGEINPESKTGTDSSAFWDLGEEVETLGLAYFFTRDERYAVQAARFARVWFIEPETRMNPHLKYAQGVRGVNDGRGTGILESRHLCEVTDGLALLAGSPAWTDQDQKALLEWLGTYYRWVTESKNGKDEAAAKNNHGSWYDAQIIQFALVLGRTEEAKQLAGSVLSRRIAVQIEPGGSQPLELARTKSFDYFCFNLEALVRLARVSAHAGVDLWNLETADKRSLRDALRFVAPFADPARPWIKNDIELDPRSRLLPLLAEALNHGDDTRLREPFAKFAGEHTRGERWHLLFNIP